MCPEECTRCGCPGVAVDLRQAARVQLDRGEAKGPPEAGSGPEACASGAPVKELVISLPAFMAGIS